MSKPQSEPFDLLKALQCPVCMELMESPIFMCQNGHNICKKCRLQLANCPVCNSNLSTTRNFLAEQLVQSLHKKCTFSKEGCSVNIPSKDLEAHLAVCDFRQVDCDLMQGKTCNAGVKVNYSKYFTHLKKVHGVQGIKGNVLNVTQFVTFEQSRLLCEMPRGVWPVQFIEIGNEIFFTGTAAVEGKIYWWLYFLGNEEQASNYISKLSLNLKAKNYESSWTGPVHSFRVSPESILKQGLCLLATTETLQPFKFVKMQHQMAQQEDLENQPNVGWNLTYSVTKKPSQRAKVTPVSRSSTSQQALSPPFQPQPQVSLNTKFAELALAASSPNSSTSSNTSFNGIKIENESTNNIESLFDSTLAIKQEPGESLQAKTNEFYRNLMEIAGKELAIKQEPLTPSSQGKKTKRRGKMGKGKSTGNLNLSG